MDVGAAFIAQSRELLTGTYLPKIRLSVERLSEEDVWWRPNQASNSVGNLLAHLAGNVRQWVVSGIGGAADVRRRQEEFDARGGASGADLMKRLTETVAEADAVLAQVRPADLLERRRIQGTDVTVLQAIYRVVEHFSTHTGQITFITKQRTAADLGFYRVADGVAYPQWKGTTR